MVQQERYLEDKRTHCSYLVAKKPVSHLREEHSFHPAMMKGNCAVLSIRFTASLSDIVTWKATEGRSIRWQNAS